MWEQKYHNQGNITMFKFIYSHKYSPKLYIVLVCVIWQVNTEIFQYETESWCHTIKWHYLPYKKSYFMITIKMYEIALNIMYRYIWKNEFWGPSSAIYVYMWTRYSISKNIANIDTVFKVYMNNLCCNSKCFQVIL